MSVEKAYVLPRDALRSGDQVYLVDAANRIRFRDVDVLRTDRQQVVITSGLNEGDRICTSPLQAAIDGMQVRLLAELEAPGLTQTSVSEPSPESEAIP